MLWCPLVGVAESNDPCVLIAGGSALGLVTGQQGRCFRGRYVDWTSNYVGKHVMYAVIGRSSSHLMRE